MVRKEEEPPRAGQEGSTFQAEQLSPEAMEDKEGLGWTEVPPCSQRVTGAVYLILPPQWYSVPSHFFVKIHSLLRLFCIRKLHLELPTCLSKKPTLELRFKMAT